MSPQTSAQKKTAALLFAAQRLRKIHLATDFDPRMPNSRPTPSQQEIFEDFREDKLQVFAILGGNRSGKSQTGRRLLATMLREDEEGSWKRPERWKGPLQFLYVAKNHKQLIGDFLRKFQCFFDDGDLHIVKQAGSSLVQVTYKPNGNTIMFFVHENPAQCRERVQAFEAHAAFLDELPFGPGSYSLIEEIQARLVDTKGYFIMSFTPKSVNKDIKGFVESLKPPFGKKYSLSFMDNPAMDEASKKMRLAQIARHSASYQKTLLEGAWMSNENLVFQLNDEVNAIASDYSPRWRHVVGVDPATDSRIGVVVLAERPNTEIWYVVKAWEEPASKDLDKSTKAVVDKVQGLNIVRWVYDAATSWWPHIARNHGVKNIVKPNDKNNRRLEMISYLQESLGSTIFIYPECERLMEELQSATWNDKVEGKIVNSKNLHNLDALRYAVDCLPKGIALPKEQTYWEMFHERANRIRAERESNKRIKASIRGPSIRQPLIRSHRIW
jgi:phage terminase large subunit